MITAMTDICRKCENMGISHWIYMVLPLFRAQWRSKSVVFISLGWNQTFTPHLPAASEIKRCGIAVWAILCSDHRERRQIWLPPCGDFSRSSSTVTLRVGKCDKGKCKWIFRKVFAKESHMLSQEKQMEYIPLFCHVWWMHFFAQIF